MPIYFLMEPETGEMLVENNFFLNWPEAFEAGTESVGGKGWNLGRLARYGFRVPAGGVLTAKAYRRFVEFNDLHKDLGEIADIVTINTIGQKETGQKLALIREKILQGRVPEQISTELESCLINLDILNKPVAVRSSASTEDSSRASFAGIHDSFLNVSGIENILSAVKGCYASLWTERAVGYRRKMGISDEEVLPAVVIMELVEAVASGIAFSCDPHTGREDVVTVNANFGLGESVVAGSIDPDKYYLHNSSYLLRPGRIAIGRKEGATVLSEDGGTKFKTSEDTRQKQVLTEENIVKLGYLILRVYDALGQGQVHQDVEWVFDGHDFVLVQARPVTVLPRYTCPEIKDQPDIWSNSNIKDTVPMVASTLSTSFNWVPNLILTSFFNGVGYQVPEGLNFIKMYQGRPYLNMSAFQWLCYDSIGFTPAELNASIGGHEPEIKIDEKVSVSKNIGKKIRMLKVMRETTKAKKNSKILFPGLREQAKNLLIQDYTKFSQNDFFKSFMEFEEMTRDFCRIFEFIAASGSFPNLLLVKQLENSFPGKGNALANAILTGAANITSAEQGYRLVELAETARNDAGARSFFSAADYNPLAWENELPDGSAFKQGFKKFLDEFGHRAVYEMDPINPRWREDPSYLLNIIRSTLETADLGKIRNSQKQTRDAAWQEINRKLPFYRRWLVKFLVKDIKKSVELRELAKSILVLLYEPVRKSAQEFGRRFKEMGIIKEQSDIYHCSWAEAVSVISGYWDGSGLDILVGERKLVWEEMEGLSPPDYIIGETPQVARQEI